MASALKNWSLDLPWTFGQTATQQSSKPVHDTLESNAAWEDEDAIVRHAQAGDSGAFERLYEIHVRRVYALCLRMLSDPGRAEDLTQDIFVRAWETIRSFQYRSAFGTWLHRLGVNVVLGDIRSRKRLEGRVSNAEDIEQFEAEAREAMPETVMDLERAIASLPDGAKEVLILHDVQGYRYREIAEMIGIAEGTVKSQLSRARRLVRETLVR